MKCNEFSPDDFITESKLREAAIDHLQVLGKVKELFMIEALEMATSQQVADFYEIKHTTLRQCIMMNREELMLDGLKVLNYPELRELDHLTLKKPLQGRAIYEDDKGNELIISYAKTTCLTKRAVLRIGMLLRDSRVAFQVRTQLLNILESTTAEQRSSPFDEEGAILLNCFRAIGDDKLEAFRDLHQYITRYVDKAERLEAANEVLTTENQVLSGEALDWDNAAVLRKLLKLYAGKRYHDVKYQTAIAYSWHNLMDELLNHHGISLKHRKQEEESKSYIGVIRDDEWNTILRVAFAMCRRKKCTLEDLNDVVRAKLEMLSELPDAMDAAALQYAQ